MELENRMSLGYQKGKYWVPDDRYAGYVSRSSYRALIRATRQAGFTFQCEYSYSARKYTAEIITLERFANSAQIYIIQHNNAYDANPMAAVTRAIRESGRMTLLLAACCLEIEAELLRDAYHTFAKAEKEQARLEAKLDLALDALASVLDAMPLNTLFNRMNAVSLNDYECEDCIGMKDHGCYCKAM